jgi:hypothetical protein
MKALNLTIAFVGILLSTLGMAITIVSTLLYVTETSTEILLLKQSFWVVSIIFVGSLILSYKSADFLNKKCM